VTMEKAVALGLIVLLRGPAGAQPFATTTTSVTFARTPEGRVTTVVNLAEAP
jgi:hypothetical protein